jgi:hypothetical protein
MKSGIVIPPALLFLLKSNMVLFPTETLFPSPSPQRVDILQMLPDTFLKRPDMMGAIFLHLNPHSCVFLYMQRRNQQIMTKFNPMFIWEV